MAVDYNGPERRHPAAPAECGRRHDCPQANDAAEAASDAAVKKVFAILGVDISKPEQVADFQDDLRFGRKLRRIADRGAMAFWSAVFVALAAALWAGITTKIGGK